MSERIFRYVEIDVDYCSLTYGGAPCAAVLGTTGDAKCFNMFRGCQDKDNFARETKTIRLCEPVSGIPIGQHFFPCILGISAQSSSVNIGGYDKRLSAFGRRATLEVTCHDFTDHDRFLDKYQGERVTGAAQQNGVGYDPGETGTFFARLKRRWPYYAGRNIRLVDAKIENGTIVVVRTRHFILTDFETDDQDRYKIKARDPLDLASNTNAVAPAPTRGVLAADVLSTDREATLSPAGIGDEDYPAEGRVIIGDELISFTRTGDVINFVRRGLRNTEASDHSADDSVQVTLSYQNERVDVVLRDLFNAADIDPSFIPDAKWTQEVDHWAWSIKITTDILKPTEISELIPELAVLGISVWWDYDEQEIGFQTIRPIDGDEITEITDDTGLKSFKSVDRDSDRLTEVYFSHVLRNPTLDRKNPENYERGRYLVGVDSKRENAFGDTKVKEINCRLIENGNDGLVKRLSSRLLKRREFAPKLYTLKLDAKDNVKLTSVLRVTTRQEQAEDGTLEPILMQVVRIIDDQPGHDYTVEAIDFTYTGKYGRIMDATTAPASYTAATDQEREDGGFIVDADTLEFPDGEPPYRFV